ncbi:MAG: bifunctional (p)ppGpp synthetase/guanosine-3',5'-bis(diphosphate) 3'-pyrophosphohydrolase [Bacilli bacterium]|jgi:(p)ppGpp synthase/HD superfamily hydrolase|nr:bifunctional (p)ppGpp synthetase/guanosine-3',5'-bis(diphosphate) 3'-pyrophosphohydrolase [Bacilli bacterium]
MKLNDIKRKLFEGNNGKYSHMLVVEDSWDYSYYVKYVYYGSDVNTIIDEINGKNLERVKEVYSYNLDLDSQLKEFRAYHVEPLTVKSRVKANFENIINGETLSKAVAFASEMHDGVFRITGEPYINHPLNVARRVCEFKDSKNLEDLLSAAFLHDVVEDTDVDYVDIVTRFGASIGALVMELTTDEDMKDALGKTRYLSIKMKNMSSWALVIKLCDVLDNLSTLSGCPIDFKHKCIDEKTEILIFLLQNRDLSDTHIKIVDAIIKKLAELCWEDNERLNKINLLYSLLSEQKNSKINNVSCLERKK